MKETALLFQPEMVLKLEAGEKTQTRRALLTQPIDILPMNGKHAGVQWITLEQRPPDPKGRVVRCRYGAAGDRLWVREAWRAPPEWDRFPPSQIPVGSPILPLAGTGVKFPSDLWGRYRHARFMPRWCSRLTLEILSVRAQRLQDISEMDAKAEGVVVRDIIYPDEPRTDYSYVHQFMLLWESINGAGSWAANPWVWAIEFKRVPK